MKEYWCHIERGNWVVHFGSDVGVSVKKVEILF